MLAYYSWQVLSETVSSAIACTPDHRLLTRALQYSSEEKKRILCYQDQVTTSLDWSNIFQTELQALTSSLVQALEAMVS